MLKMFFMLPYLVGTHPQSANHLSLMSKHGSGQKSVNVIPELP